MKDLTHYNVFSAPPVLLFNMLRVLGRGEGKQPVSQKTTRSFVSHKIHKKAKLVRHKSERYNRQILIFLDSSFLFNKVNVQFVDFLFPSVDILTCSSELTHLSPLSSCPLVDSMNDKDE